MLARALMMAAHADKEAAMHALPMTRGRPQRVIVSLMALHLAREALGRERAVDVHMVTG